ncbi:MAG: FAD-dependent oxidoreductase [Wenzhouxiangellaceae bacterium]|nr:FAD-dependent oxidoreductase [Wenzhouxiangellaceae bacterium]
MSFDVLIIGAGWAGLTAAGELAANGHRVQVLEKARGPGGRSATRRVERARFDHGAQYFTARSAAFARQLQQWRDLDVAGPWRPRLKVIGDHGGHSDPDAVSRYVAMPGMNGICRHMAGSLDCRYQARVERVSHDGGWQVQLVGGETLAARKLLITAPAPQTTALLGEADPLHGALHEIRFEPCLSAMVTFASAFDPGFDAGFVNEAGALSWLACNSSKPGRRGHDWVLHATPDWSRSWLEAEFDEVAERLLEALAQLVDVSLPEVDWLAGHRWRYAHALNPLREGFLFDAERSLAVAGDWASGNRIEGAWTSGRKAGRWLAELG